MQKTALNLAALISAALLLTLRQPERLKTAGQQQRDLPGTVKEPGCVESIKRLHAFLQGEIKRMRKEVRPSSPQTGGCSTTPNCCTPSR